MLDRNLLFSWLFVLNGAWLVLFMFAWMKLPASRQRTLFLTFLFPYSLWANSLFLIQLVGANHSLSRLISQSIFAGGAAYHVLLGTLLISLAAPTELRTLRCWALGCNTVVLIGLAYVGIFERGVQLSPGTGLSPIPGPYLWYFNLSLLAWALYYFLVIVIAYRRMQARDLLKCQLKVLVFPAVISMSLSLTTNVIVPGLTGDYSLTAVGGFWLFIFFASVAYIIKMGEIILLYHSVSDFDRRLPYSAWGSINELGQIVHSTVIRSSGISALHDRPDGAIALTSLS